MLCRFCAASRSERVFLKPGRGGMKCIVCDLVAQSGSRDRHRSVLRFSSQQKPQGYPLVAKHAQKRGFHRNIITTTQRNALVLAKNSHLLSRSPSNEPRKHVRQASSGGTPSTCLPLHPILSKHFPYHPPHDNPHVPAVKRHTLTAPPPGYGKEDSGC